VWINFVCSSSRFVWHDSLVTPNLRFLSYIDFLSPLVFSRLKLLTFSSFQYKLFCLDWVGELVLVVEIRFLVDTTRARRLQATTTLCACSYNLKQQWTLLLAQDGRKCAQGDHKVSHLSYGQVSLPVRPLCSSSISKASGWHWHGLHCSPPTNP